MLSNFAQLLDDELSILDPKTAPRRGGDVLSGFLNRNLGRIYYYYYYYYYYYLPKARRARGGAGPYWSWKKLPGRLWLYMDCTLPQAASEHPPVWRVLSWGGVGGTNGTGFTAWSEKSKHCCCV